MGHFKKVVLYNNHFLRGSHGESWRVMEIMYSYVISYIYIIHMYIYINGMYNFKSQVFFVQTYGSDMLFVKDTLYGDYRNYTRDATHVMEINIHDI